MRTRIAIMIIIILVTLLVFMVRDSDTNDVMLRDIEVKEIAGKISIEAKDYEQII